MRLRQIALVAAHLAPVEQDLNAILGLETCHRDPAVARWGLINAVLPLGGDFLEIVSPTRPDTSAGRYLARRGGDGGYMVILQAEDALPWRERLEAQGVRVVASADRDGYRYSHFHPADTGGILLSIESVTPNVDLEAEHCPWPPAGPAYAAQIRTGAFPPPRGHLRAAELQSTDPAAMAALWSRLLDRQVVKNKTGAPEIRLGKGLLRFVPVTDRRGPGLGLVEIALADPATAFSRGAARGLPGAADLIEIGGLRFRLVAA